MKRTTKAIGRVQLANLLNAFAYAEQIKAPLNTFVTIRWERTAGWDPASFPEHRERLFWNLARWLRRRDIPSAWVWVLESPGRIGLHMHLQLHIPAREQRPFRTALEGMIAGFVPGRMILDIREDARDRGRTAMVHPNQRLGTVRYLLKGMDHAAVFTDQEGTVQNLGAFLGINHRGSQGEIAGKRCGTSQSIGAKARAVAGYKDAVMPSELQSILTQHPKAKARPEGSAPELEGSL